MLIRIITAAVLAPVFILLTLKLSVQWFAMLVMAVLLIGLHEWNNLGSRTLAGYIAAAAAMIFAGHQLLFVSDVLITACAAIGVFWLWQIYDLYRNGRSEVYLKYRSMFVGAIVLFAAWAALVLLHQQSHHGPRMALAVLVIIWSADCGAYFIGRFLGRHRFAPEISPNKTIEGLLGGSVSAGIAAAAFASLAMDLKLTDTEFYIWMSAAIISSLISVVGDLFQSRMKRIADVKDSGGLLPGHGGVLDRIDGLIAAAPVFASIWWAAL